MPIKTPAAITVTTAATALLLSTTHHGTNVNPVTIVLNSISAAIYIGGADVTAATGWLLNPGDTPSIDLREGDDLYAITASSTATVRTFRTRN